MTQGTNQVRYVTRELGRELTVPERNLIVFEPMCMGWCVLECFYFTLRSASDFPLIISGRSDRIMRMEAAEKGLSTPNTLKPCPGCSLAFYCSDSHWDAVATKHTTAHMDHPDLILDPPSLVSQCVINRQIRLDIGFAGAMAGANMGEFRWAPERVLPKWESLEGTTMEQEFGVEMGEKHGIPEVARVPWMRAATDGVSMPMTILWALEVLNGKDDSWTKKDTLNIHVSDHIAN
jgi:splicing suppressor protein 51